MPMTAPHHPNATYNEPMLDDATLVGSVRGTPQYR